MARIVYEDEGITEYDDGTETVRFSEAEWEVMLNDPAFGYVCRNGHRLSESDNRFIVAEGICPHCFGEAEDAYYEYLAEHPEEDEAMAETVEAAVADVIAPEYDEEPF